MSEIRERDWQAMLTRVSAFPAAPVGEPLSLGTWEDLVGQEPDKQATSPKARTRTEVGTWQDGILELELSPIRVDLRYRAREFDASQLDSYPYGIPTIGPAAKALRLLCQTASPWLSRLPPLARLALGAEVLTPAADHITAYGILDGLLPSVAVDGTASTNFHYTINRRRESNALAEKGVWINRLSKWSAVSIGLKFGDTSASHLVDTQSMFFSAVELDINTAPQEGITIDTESEVASLLAEFQELAVEILAHGDVP